MPENLEFAPTPIVSPQPSASHWSLSILMGFSSLLNLFLPLYLVRILSPEQIGVYKIFFLYAATVPWAVFSAGLTNGYYYWGGRSGVSREAMQTTWALQNIWMFAVVCLGLLSTPLIMVYLGWHLMPSSLLVIAAALAITSTSFEDVQIASGQPSRAAKYGAAFEAGRTVLLIIGAAVWRTVEAVFLIHITVSLLKWIISVRRLNRDGFPVWFSRGLIGNEVLRYALPSSVGAALLLIVNYTDQFILVHRLSPAEFATYSLGCLTIPPLLIFEQSVNKILIPRLSREFEKGEERRAAFIHRAAVGELALWLIPSAIGLFFFAGPITRLLYTDRYPEAEYFLKAFAISYTFFILPYDAWARATGRTGWILRIVAIFAAVALVTIFSCTHYWGAWGALVALLVTQLALRVASMVSLAKTYRWAIQQFLPIQSILLYLISAVAIGFVTSQLSHFLRSEVAGLIICGTLFWILYVLFIIPIAQSRLRRERGSKKVLMLTQFLHVGGLETMILNLATDLKTRTKWNPTVFVYDHIGGAATMTERFSDIPVIEFRKGRGVSLKLVLKLVRTTSALEIDVIHAHDMGPLLYSVLAKILSGGRLKVIFTQHSFVHLAKHRRYRFYERVFTRFADQICVVSSPMVDEYVAIGVPRTKIKVVENGVPFFTPVLDEPKRHEIRARLAPFLAPHELTRDTWLLSLARLHPGKGQDHLLRIWEKLKPETRARARLFLVGSETSAGFLEQLKSQALRGPDPDRVSFVGASQHPADWLNAADLYLSASEKEGLPLGPIEALGTGLPALISKIEAHEILRDFVTLFDLRDLEGCARILDEGVHAFSTSTRPRRAVPRELRERFDLARMTDTYVEIFEHTLCAAPKKTPEKDE